MNINDFIRQSNEAKINDTNVPDSSLNLKEQFKRARASAEQNPTEGNNLQNDSKNILQQALNQSKTEKPNSFKGYF